MTKAKRTQKLLEETVKRIEATLKKYHETMEIDTMALNTDIVKMKSELIGILKNEIKSVSTYRLQKMGIDKKQYNRIRENPEQMSMETMVKYLVKIRAQKN
jgi:hypothetical protein